jgi:serine protease Do
MKLALWKFGGVLLALLWGAPAALAAPSELETAASAEAISAELRAKTEALARASAAVVGVRVIAVEDARSIATLGRARQGTGVVIGDDGLVLTIGYRILEADRVELVLDGPRVMPARVVAYDLASGFGLLQPLAPLRLPSVQLGDSSALSSDEPLMIASGGEAGDLSIARMVSRRAFSGYWEYHIDGALFTTPPRTDHSGAALFNANGELLGIGSLVVMDALGPGQPRMAGNMFVPVNLLKPILPELRTRGATRASTRAWLGLNCVEVDGMVRVVRITPESPAEDAGVLPGDQIMRIDDVRVDGLEGLYKALWQDGAEREITLVIRRSGAEQVLKAKAQDRMKTLRRAKGI